MKAFKGTNNGKCFTLNYEVGKTYTFEGELKMCERGFHFCKEMKHVFSYYSFNKDFVMLEIEILGEVIDHGDKSVTDKIKILRIVSPKEYEHICFIEYDESGNEIHSKSPYDVEKWHEYDESGNIIHSKNSYGTVFWKEYDKKGNMIHYKDSDDGTGWKINIQ